MGKDKNKGKIIITQEDVEQQQGQKPNLVSVTSNKKKMKMKKKYQEQNIEEESEDIQINLPKKTKKIIKQHQTSKNQGQLDSEGENNQENIPKIKNKKKKKNKQKKTQGLAQQRPIGIQLLDQLKEQQQINQRQGNNGRYKEQDRQQERQSGLLNHKILDISQKTKKTIKIKHLAICFPDSILQIPQTSSLRAYFISQVARVSSIYKVDEIVILRDHGYTSKSQNFQPAEYIARNLQYLETPQYLRKHLFKMHADLQNAGLMNPIECHHHLKTHDVCEFREGVTLERPTKKNSGSWVDIGLKQQAQMDMLVPPGTRVTLRLKEYEDNEVKNYEGEAVTSKTPRIQQNLYWGYSVRIAQNIKQILYPRDSPQSYTVKILCNTNSPLQSLKKICPSDNSFNILAEHQNQTQNDMQDEEQQEQSVMIFFSGTDNIREYLEKDSKNKLSVDQTINMFEYSLQFKNYGVQKLRIQEQMWMGLGAITSIRELPLETQNKK